MPTFWHVAGPSYRQGDDLICWNTLVEDGVLTDADWKWPDAPIGADGHLVSLLPDTEEGRQERDWITLDVPGGGIILRIDIPDEALADRYNGMYIEGPEIEMTRIIEGLDDYPAVVGRIPASYITVVNPTV